MNARIPDRPVDSGAINGLMCKMQIAANTVLRHDAFVSLAKG